MVMLPSGIISVINTEKTQMLSANNVYCFLVKNFCTKKHISGILSSRYGVQIVKINTSNFEMRKRRPSRKGERKYLLKKCFVRLAKGQSLNFEGVN